MTTWPAFLGSTRRRKAVFAIACLLGLLWISQSIAPAGAIIGNLMPVPREGSAAPDFTLPDLDGDSVTLSSLRGQVVIVNLWTSWCPPCREEMPALEQVYRQFGDRGLLVLGVNSTSQDDEASAAAFVRELGLTFPILFDRDGAVSRRYKLQALPTTYFIDRQGIIRSVVLGGPLRREVIESKIVGLLSETSAAEK